MRKDFGMQVEAEKYLLDIRTFVERGDRQMLIEEAFAKLDEERAEKARRIRQEKGLAASLGAGLLLQFAVRRAEAAGTAGGVLVQCTVPGLLESLDAPLPLAYRYGQGGKPYFTNYSYYFNLSHSGDYVVCALSEREVGIDIQVHRPAAYGRVAGRYFSPAEVEAFQQAKDRQAFFFRLWARKEAYGKLTGKGIVDVVGKDLWSGGPEADENEDEALCFEEYDGLPGYSMAVCQRGDGEGSLPGKGAGALRGNLKKRDEKL